MASARVFGAFAGRVLMAAAAKGAPEKATASGGAASTKVVKKTVASKSNGGIQKVVPVSSELGQFLGSPQVSRTDAVKRVWEYMKMQNLQGEDICVAAVREVKEETEEFAEITKEGSLEFLAMRLDGILGLGFQDISVAFLLEASSLALDICSSMLMRRSEWSISPFINIEVGDILLANNSTGLCQGGCAAIIDSGTSLIAGPTVLELGVLSRLMIMVKSDSIEEGIKALYAVSALIRNNLASQELFYADAGGYLRNATIDMKLRRKDVLLLTDLVKYQLENVSELRMHAIG